MAFHFGCRIGIVKNGLVLYLDAANTRSYPGSGTTWRDISGNNYNATLTNGPTFTTQGAGGISYDGVNDYVVGNNSLATNINSQITIISFANIRNMAARNTLFSKYNTSPPYGYNFEVGTAGGAWTNTMRFYAGGSILANSNDYRGLIPLSANTNYMFTLVYNFTSAITRMYYNLTEMPASQAGNNTIDSSWSQGSNLYTLGSYRPFFNIDANMVQYNCLVYNRALSLVEITQNYNALKSRFGLT